MNTQNTWLNESRKSYHAQHGEDGVIEAILNELPERDSWGVEFGGWDGLYNSNLRYFIEKDNLKGVFIEGDGEKAEKINSNYPDNKNIYAINLFVEPSGENSLDNLLSKTPIPTDFDFCVIDIDGNDYHVWEGVKQYRPKLVVIEFNPTIPNEVDFVQDWNPVLNHGKSLSTLIRLGKEKDFELVATSLNNGFFVDKKYFTYHNIADNSINDLSRVTYFFNGYDRIILLSGSQVVDLHNVEYRSLLKRGVFSNSFSNSIS